MFPSIYVPQIKVSTTTASATKQLLLIKLQKALELTRASDSLVMITQDDVKFCGNLYLS